MNAYNRKDLQRKNRRRNRSRCNSCRCDNQFTTLDEISVGQRCRVVSVNNENAALRKKIIDMGLTNGVEVCVNKIAPLGDPVDIKLRGYNLCMRKSDMKQIQVEVIE